MNESLIAEKIESDGVTTVMAYEEFDQEYANPRQHDCNVGTMMVSYRGYDLGDEDPGENGLPTIDCPMCDGGEKEFEGPKQQGFFSMQEHLIDIECPRCENFGEVEPTIQEWMVANEIIAAMGLYVYEHSGISMSSGRFFGPDDVLKPSEATGKGRNPFDMDGWDTSFVGFIYTTPAKVEETGVAVAGLEKALEGEVEEYDRYLRGEVFYIYSEDEDGEEVGDACGGYLGHEYAESCLKDHHQEAVADRKRELELRADAASRDIVTV